MRILLIFDERIRALDLRRQINLLKPAHISIFALTSYHRLTSEIEKICNSVSSAEITTNNSADLIDKEVDALRAKLFKWSAELAGLKICGKPIKDWFLLPSEGVSTWWFSRLFEKNPHKTNAFFKIAQLQAIDRVIASGGFSLCVYSLGKPSFSKGLQLLLSRHRVNFVRVPSSSRNVLFKERIRLYCNRKKVFNSILKALINLFIYIFRAAMTRLLLGPANKRIKKFRDSILFVSFFPSVDKAAAKDGILKNKYAGFLQDKIYQMQKKIIWIWLYNFLDGCNYLEAVRLAKRFNKNHESTFFLCEFLSSECLFKAIFSWFRQLHIFVRLKALIPDNDLSANLSIPESGVFIKELMLDSFVGWPALEGLITLGLYKKIFFHFSDSSHCIYYAEMQAWEKALCAAKKIIAPHMQNVAYIHSSVPINFFSYFQHKSEIRHIPLPDVLACNGDVSFQLMRDCGYPNVKKVEAVRYLYLERYLESRVSFRKDDSVLIAGCGIYPEDKRLLSLFYEAFPKAAGLKVWLKGHPCLPLEEVIEELEIDIKKSGYIIKNDSLEDLLKPVKVLIVGSSTIALEALLAGCRVIIPSFCDGMFISPLQGFEKYYTKVSTPQGLKYSVIKSIKGVADYKLSQVRDFIRQYWCLDASLKRWKGLLEGLDTGQTQADNAYDAASFDNRAAI